MCFAPQRRALFRHLNFQKWSGLGVFCTFWLRNVLRATTACTFSTPQLRKAVRSWGVLRILTWKCASRHNGVQFFISNLARWLCARRFSEPTFRPSGATNHWKTQCFATFLPFRAPGSSFFWGFLFLLLFCDSAHLCFSSVHIVGSLISKLPSTMLMILVGFVKYWSSIKRWLGLGESSPTGRWGWCFLLVQIKWKGLTNWPFGRWLVLFVEAWLYFGNIKHYFSTLAQQEGENMSTFLYFYIYNQISCFRCPQLFCL